MKPLENRAHIRCQVCQSLFQLQYQKQSQFSSQVDLSCVMPRQYIYVTLCVVGVKGYLSEMAFTHFAP